MTMVEGTPLCLAQSLPGSHLSQFYDCMRKLIVHITCNYSYCIIVLFLIIFLILQKINLCIIIKYVLDLLCSVNSNMYLPVCVGANIEKCSMTQIIAS